MSANEECPVCGEGTLHEREGEDTLSYKGQNIRVPDYYSVCDVCGSEIADEEQSRKNKRAAIVAKKRVAGIPLGEEIRAMRERYGITQKDASQLFGGGPTAFSKYENDDVVPAASMSKLLRLAIEHPVVLKWLAGYEDLAVPEINENLDIEVSFSVVGDKIARLFECYSRETRHGFGGVGALPFVFEREFKSSANDITLNGNDDERLVGVS